MDKPSVAKARHSWAVRNPLEALPRVREPASLGNTCTAPGFVPLQLQKNGYNKTCSTPLPSPPTNSPEPAPQGRSELSASARSSCTYLAPSAGSTAAIRFSAPSFYFRGFLLASQFSGCALKGTERLRTPLAQEWLENLPPDGSN